MRFQSLFAQVLLLKNAVGFWDLGTTTLKVIDHDVDARNSFFRWVYVPQRPLTFSMIWNWWMFSIDWDQVDKLRRLRNLAGISIDKHVLGVAIILNRRTLLSAANYLEPWLYRSKDLRVWALGRAGKNDTPYRYRVWRVRRLLPRSNNPEHHHGPTGEHVPRHDLCIIHTLDQMYVYGVSTRHLYANRGYLPGKHDEIQGEYYWFAGSGYQSLKDIRENYKMKRVEITKDYIVDCSHYLPKWWGKFICFINAYHFPGTQNGMAFFATTYYTDYVYGVGCFEIRYNEERISVYTDIRYYIDLIQIYANITPGDYYEYAYPKWSIPGGLFFDGNYNAPYIPSWTIWGDIHPLGRR